MRRSLVGMLLFVAACGAASAHPSDQGNLQCDPRDPHRIQPSDFEEPIGRSLELPAALAEWIERCTTRDARLDVQGADEDAIIQACRAGVAQPNCVWDCTLHNLKSLAVTRLHAAEGIVADLPQRVAAHPECPPGRPPALFACLGIRDPAVDPPGATVIYRSRSGSHPVEVGEIDVSTELLPGLPVRIVGRAEEGGCGTGTVWSTYAYF